MEYLSRGNLKDLLKDSRSKGGRVYGNLHGISESLTSKDLMKFAKDAADGMAFISSQKVTEFPSTCLCIDIMVVNNGFSVDLIMFGLILTQHVLKMITLLI